MSIANHTSARDVIQSLHGLRIKLNLAIEFTAFGRSVPFRHSPETSTMFGNLAKARSLTKKFGRRG